MGSPISDTGELLRGVDADARESYYRTSALRYDLYTITIVLLLAIAVIGIMHGELLGYVLALGGAFGLVLVCILLVLH